MQCDIEEKYYNKAYLRVFEGMLADYGMIAIAVYRVNEVSGLPFVYTCPHPMDTVLESDKIFAIASFPCSTKCSNFWKKLLRGLTSTQLIKSHYLLFGHIVIFY